MTERAPSPWLLETRGVTKRFGGLTAVKSLTLTIPRGALYGLIGPNGAGKTTVFNLLTGQYEPTEGEILFEGVRVDGRKPYQIAALGIARTFQNIRLFPDMTVLENVMAAPRPDARARHVAQAAPARRARSRHESAGVARSHAPHPLAAGRVPDHDPARRAQHEGRDGHLRDDSGHRLRRGDRHRHAA
jgi:ABC-type branched-subunit amino acid transport system ATPase component